ncbi:MAG: ABC transporter ATP-binding protein [Treponema sp.]|jgi:peptide/nickel transport system ATP-binding protein|nr:ABC transporter ATP-binding protein [Treponema sp.]
MTEQLRIERLTVSFSLDDSTVEAVNSAGLTIPRKACCGLIGETGCGKSVLGQAILGLLPRNATVRGHIYFEGQDLAHLPSRQFRSLRGREIALIAQNPAEALDPLMTNGKQILESITLNTRKHGSDAKETAKALLRSLRFADPEDCMNAYPHELSGGMKQRVLAAMGMSGTPKLLIADEPTKGLDPLARGQVVGTLRTFIRATGAASLIITHDLELARNICDYTAVMYAGEIVETGEAREVFFAPKHPYTQALIASEPKNGLHPIPGDSINLSNLPIGCPFFLRCAKAVECSRGETERPDLSGGTHQARCFLS